VSKIRIVALSDVHTRWERITVPEGDVLIIAGDLCENQLEEYGRANKWIESLAHHHKLYVPGNHDSRPIAEPSLLAAAQVLVDQRLEIGPVSFYAAPWPTSGREDYERLIPAKVDVLITHEPPFGIRDWTWSSDARLGNHDLLKAVRAKKPRIHIFGHCHDAYGHETRDGILFANVCICDRQFRAAHAPTVVDVSADRITVLE